MRKIPHYLALFFLIPWLIGCGGDPDGHPAFHDCPRSYNDDWFNREFVLLHHEPRLCPVKAERGDWIFTGGDVYDRGQREADRSILQVFNSNLEGIAHNIEDFMEGPGFFSSNDWWVEISLFYEAWTGASNFDRGEYTIRLLPDFSGAPGAIFEVNYDQGCIDCF